MARRDEGAFATMRTVRVNRYRVGKRALEEARRTLETGGVVAFPTETSYGLAADPANPRAMRRVYAIKGREKGKPLPLVAADAAQAGRHATLSAGLRRLVARHWPGPLTVVARARAAALRRIAPDGTVAIRVPGAAWARALPGAFGRPVTSTSANLSGEPPLFSGAAVRRAFKGRAAAPDLLLDAGALPKRKPSTIVRARRGRMEVVREGAIPEEKLKS